MSNLSPELELAVFLARLSPEQRQTFLANARDAHDRELAKYPELLAALQPHTDSDQFVIPADLQTSALLARRSLLAQTRMLLRLLLATLPASKFWILLLDLRASLLLGCIHVQWGMGHSCNMIRHS
jgi:hypothetical protein